MKTQIIRGIYLPIPTPGFGTPATNVGFGFFRVSFGRFCKPNFWVWSKLSMNQNFFQKQTKGFFLLFFFEYLSSNQKFMRSFIYA